MYDLRQFKPAFYALLLLGISGYSVSAQTPGVWVFGCFFVVLHAWLAFRGRFAPMKRLLTNMVTLGVLGFVLLDAVLSVGNTPVLLVGEFLVLLQLVKLWEQRNNRDYAQLLVLGLLLMVAAAISTPSLWFALIFLAYLFLSLYCCLLFHLKVESELAQTALGRPRLKFSSATLRQDQRYLPRSMWRLSLTGSLVAIAFGVGVFLVFPRGVTGGLLGPFQFRTGQVLVGFSDQVSFQNIARLQQSNETVAWVKVKHNGEPVEGGSLLLRGTVLDTYHGNQFPADGPKYQWTRTEWEDELPGLGDRYEFPVQAGSAHALEPSMRYDRLLVSRFRRGPEWYPPPSTQPNDRWELQVTLKPTGTNVLFSVAGPLTIEPVARQLHITYSRSQQVIQTRLPLSEPVDYIVVATNQIGGPIQLPTMARQRERLSWIDPQITAFARRPEVSGTNAAGPLAVQRNPLHPSPRNGLAGPDVLDGQIAANIEKYLKTNYAYTLDLTDTRQIQGHDPLVAFLTDFKRGHCEYFAGAMTELCQSLGLQARMVVGFHCDSDASVGGYYLVQQSHAHAWVEVLTTEGWQTFDPTSSTGAATRRQSLWQGARNFLNYLDFAYARSVVAFDGDNQTNLAQRAEQRMLNTVYQSTAFLDPIRKLGFTRWLADNVVPADAFWTALLRAFIALMSLLLICAVGWYSWERFKLRRRAERIGIASLPIDEQMRLARQLGFYDDLLRMLARYRIHRARHQTPLEFSRSLLFLPADVYDTILRLTTLFYRVRYGRAELTPDRKKHLSVVLGQLGEELEGRA